MVEMEKVMSYLDTFPSDGRQISGAWMQRQLLAILMQTKHACNIGALRAIDLRACHDLQELYVCVKLT